MIDNSKIVSEAEKLNRRLKSFIPAYVGFLLISGLIAWSILDTEHGSTASTAIFISMIINIFLISHTHSQTKMTSAIIRSIKQIQPPSET